MDKQRKTVVVMDVANDSKIKNEEHEKLERYRGLREEL